VDYAIERGEYSEAFRIAEKTCKEKMPEVHLAHAMALEDEGNFERAEEEFIKAKKPQEAIDMYVHQRKWEAAMRVAEGHDAAMILQVYERQALSLQEQKNYSQAEVLYLSAKKPESAIKMYKDSAMWDDALRLAKVHVPRQVQLIQQERQSGAAGTPAADGAEFLVNQAKLLVQSKNYSAAIDAYLKVTKEQVPNYDNLLRIWESACSLANENLQSRAVEVANVVGKRLLEIERYEQAAEIFNSVDMFKEAIEACLTGKLWDKARSIVAESAPQFNDYVEKSHQKFMLALETAGVKDLGGMNADVALDTMVQRGDWDKVYDLASRQGASTVAKYISLHAATLVKAVKYKEALAVFTKKSTPLIPANFQLYLRITQEVLSESEDKSFQQRGEDSMTLHQELREFLYSLCKDMRTANSKEAMLPQFERFLLIAHVCYMKEQTYKHGLKNLTAKAATALLRYTTDIPVDKYFYDAGVKCREANMGAYAFVFLNRFVDLTDLIDDPDSGDIDNSDFVTTDIPSPFSVPMPSKPSYTEEQREEAREWVLDAGVKDSGQALAMRLCDHCAKNTYAAGVTCHSCKEAKDPCVVTGWPVLRETKVQCTSCQKPANRDDWNAWIGKTKMCPWCNSAQNQVLGVRR
jgi:intraflagellar transport protein 172